MGRVTQSKSGPDLWSASLPLEFRLSDQSLCSKAPVFDPAIAEIDHGFMINLLGYRLET
jgi:hypothetical protein